MKYILRMPLRFMLPALLMLGLVKPARACSPIVVPTLLTQTIVGNNLILSWQSNTTYNCTYSIQVEFICNNSPFGSGVLFYSAPITKTSTPQAYDSQTISLSQFCAGTSYKFRAREVEGGAPSIASPYTAIFTFTTPGTFIPPTLSLGASSVIICPPQTSTLFPIITNSCGTGPVSYSWSPSTYLSSTSAQNPVASPSANITYTCVATETTLGCWTITNTITLSLNNSPPIAGSPGASPANICVGKSATISLTSYSGNIAWESGSSASGPWTSLVNGGTPTFVTAPLNNNTCFRAIVSSCTSSTSTSPICVTTNTIPTLFAGVKQMDCATPVALASFTAMGTSGTHTSAVWTPTPLSVASLSSVAGYTTPGQASVTVSFPDGCVSSTVFPIYPPAPVPTVTLFTNGTNITCNNPSVLVNTATSYTLNPLTYYWQHPSVNYSTSTVTLIYAGTYTLSVSDPITQCVVTKTLAVGVNTTAPVSAITPSYQVINCTNSTIATVTLNVSSPTLNLQQEVTSPLGGTYVNYATQVIYQGSVPGTYTYCAKDLNNGCSTCKQFTVFSNSAFPTYSVSSPQNFTLGCNSKSVAAVNITDVNSGGGSVSYTILTNASTIPYGTGPVSNFTLSTPGTYTLVTRDNTSNCDSRIPITILSNTFGPSIDTMIVPRQVLDCSNPKVTLQGKSYNPDAAYNWSFPGVPGNLAGSSITVAINNTVAPSNTVIANYTLTITDQNNTCTSFTVVPMLQDLFPPKARITGASSITCTTPTVLLSNGSTSGIPPNLFFPGPSSKQVIGYHWEGPSPQVPADVTSSYVALIPGVYTLTAQDLENGCTSVTTTVIDDNRVYPVIDSTGAVPLDCGAGSVTLTPSITSATNNLRFQWFAPPGTIVSNADKPVITVDSPGEYQVVVTNTVNGCGSFALLDVVNGTLNASVSPDKLSGYAPLTVTFKNTSSSVNSNSITTVWVFGNGTASTTPSASLSPVTVYSQPGTYTVHVYTAKGACQDTVTKVIRVEVPSALTIPNIFTPNGDGVNDVFFLKTANLTSISMEVHDRWGKEVYRITSGTGNVSWDGTDGSGHDLAEGVYFYWLKATGADGVGYENKGTITLLR